MRFALRLHTSRDLNYTAAHQSSRLEQKTIGINRHGTEEASYHISFVLMCLGWMAWESVMMN